MKKKIYKNLITTGLKEIKGGKDDLFLGEWCLVNNKLKDNQNKYEVCDYHLNIKKKLQIGHIYLTSLYKKILPAVSQSLNVYHGTKKSKKYWEIIVGPTLVQLLSILWDRWQTISIVIKKHRILQIPIVNYSSQDFITQDFNDLFTKVSTHYWNNCIFSELIKKNFKVKIAKIKRKKKYTKKRPFNYWSKNKLLKEFKSFQSKKCKFIFFDEKLNDYNLLKFCLTQGSFFNKHNVFTRNIELKKKINQRNITINFNTQNSFEKIIVRKIINFFPISHLEGMNKIGAITKKINLKSKYIFTVYGHVNNDFFKVWLAEQIESKNSKLIIAHHGGTIEKEVNFNSWENVSDKLIGWEKKDKPSKKYIQLNPNFLDKEGQNLKKIYKIFFKNRILFFTSSSSLYTYRLEDRVLSSQIMSYLNHWKFFFNNLPLKLKNKIIIRNNPQFDPWNLNKNLNSFFKRKVCSNIKDVYKDIYSSKILINTSISTTFFQSMDSGIPTMLLLKDDLWNLSLNGKKIYNIFKKNKIIFTNPNQMVDHLITIYKDPIIWWNAKETVEARNLFNEHFMKNGDFNDWCKYLKSLK